MRPELLVEGRRPARGGAVKELWVSDGANHVVEGDGLWVVVCSRLRTAHIYGLLAGILYQNG